MRTPLLTIGLIACIVAPVRADDAKAIIDKAVKATASSDLRLNRLQNVIRTEKGTFFVPGADTPARRTAYLGPPERIKFDAVLGGSGDTQPVVLSLNGAGGWKSMNGAVTALTVLEYDALADEADAWGLITLLPLRKKGVTLKTLPPATVNGKAAVGVDVSRHNRPDARIYFAADSGLPLKLRLTVRAAGVEVAREIDVSGYRDFDGIKLPTHITVTQNGRKIEDWTIQDYKYPDKLDDKLFVKPKK